MQLAATTGISAESSGSTVSGFQPANINPQGSCYASALEAFISSQNGEAQEDPLDKCCRSKPWVRLGKKTGTKGFRSGDVSRTAPGHLHGIHSSLSRSTSTSLCPAWLRHLPPLSQGYAMLTPRVSHWTSSWVLSSCGKQWFPFCSYFREIIAQGDFLQWSYKGRMLWDQKCIIDKILTFQSNSVSLQDFYQKTKTKQVQDYKEIKVEREWKRRQMMMLVEIR